MIGFLLTILLYFPTGEVVRNDAAFVYEERICLILAEDIMSHPTNLPVFKDDPEVKAICTQVTLT